MAVANVMVQYSGRESSYARASLARSVASWFDARLIGVAAHAPPLAVSGDLVDGEQTHLPGGDFVEEEPLARPETAPISAWLAELGQEFQSIVRKDNLRVEWRAGIDEPTHYLITEARAADLVILGRETRFDAAERAVDPASVLLRCGRPVLLVPPDLDSVAGKHIVIGWKERREARRAVRDALAFLKRAEQVTIVEVEEPGSAVDRGALADLAAYLVQHKVAGVDILTPVVGDGVAATLIAVAGDRGADLIVSGGYGHSRTAEWVFGGVTRDLFTMAPLCCLLSH